MIFDVCDPFPEVWTDEFDTFPDDEDADEESDEYEEYDPDAPNETASPDAELVDDAFPVLCVELFETDEVVEVDPFGVIIVAADDSLDEFPDEYDGLSNDFPEFDWESDFPIVYDKLFPVFAVPVADPFAVELANASPKVYASVFDSVLVTDDVPALLAVDVFDDLFDDELDADDGW